MADEIDEPTVPHDSNDVHEAEWQGDPDVCSFQPRNPTEDEVSWCQAGTVGSMHDDKSQSKLPFIFTKKDVLYKKIVVVLLSAKDKR